MIKLLIFGILGFFALIILAFKGMRAEKLNNVFAKLGMSKDEKGKIDGQLLDVLNRSFLFAKGAYYKIENAYSRENPTHNLLDISYSSQGNSNVTYQRLVFVLETVSHLNHGFVVENATRKSGIILTDLEIAGFDSRNYSSNQLTYVKTISQDEFAGQFEPVIKPLVKLYPDICIELHSNRLLVYQNQTGLSIEKLPLFYAEIVKAFMPILKRGQSEHSLEIIPDK